MHNSQGSQHVAHMESAASSACMCRAMRCARHELEIWLHQAASYLVLSHKLLGFQSTRPGWQRSFEHASGLSIEPQPPTSGLMCLYVRGRF